MTTLSSETRGVLGITACGRMFPFSPKHNLSSVNGCDVLSWLLEWWCKLRNHLLYNVC